MKKLFSMVVFCFAAGTIACGQIISKPPGMMTQTELGNYHLKKSKSQKTWGWVMLATSAGFYVAANSLMQNEKIYDTDKTGGKLCFLMGTGALIGTIPLFSSSARNKGRAEILLNMEKIPIGYFPNAPTAYPAIGLGIPISRQ